MVMTSSVFPLAWVPATLIATNSTPIPTVSTATAPPWPRNPTSVCVTLGTYRSKNSRK